MNQPTKCPHLNCLVHHPDGVCACNMGRWCEQCQKDHPTTQTDSTEVVNSTFLKLFKKHKGVYSHADVEEIVKEAVAEAKEAGRQEERERCMALVEKFQNLPPIDYSKLGKLLSDLESDAR